MVPARPSSRSTSSRSRPTASSTGQLSRHRRADERAADEFVAPTTSTERRIAEIWQEVLGLETVGAADHFFHLGGHSLLAARVVTKVRDEFAVELSVRALFERPVAGLVRGGRRRAARARAMCRAAAIDSPPAVGPGNDRTRCRSSNSSCCSSMT